MAAYEYPGISFAEFHPEFFPKLHLEIADSKFHLCLLNNIGNTALQVMIYMRNVAWKLIKNLQSLSNLISLF